MTRRTSPSDEVKRDLRRRPEREPVIKPSDYLSTGSTLLNLACSGDPKGGFIKGKYYFLVGDSQSGKTWLSLSCMAEASINKEFDKYRFIYDNAEDGALMDVKWHFGGDVAKRLEPPRKDRDGPIYSETIEDFYYHLDDAFAKDKPFIYVMDSMDVLTSKAEQSKFQEKKTAARKGTKTAGEYTDGKAKINSSTIRQLIPRLRRSGSILVIVNQTRDNIGAGLFESKKTRSGGRALTFYSSLELWSSVATHIKRKVRGKDRELGVVCRVRVKKNRLTGRDRTVEIPIYHSFGIDDIGSCVDYLVGEKHWKKKDQAIDAVDFDLELPKDKLVESIEEDELEGELRELVGSVWNEIERACELKRKRRYE